MHILMADDDKDDFYLLQEAIEKTDVSVDLTYAANWLELWRQLLKFIPDILLLDINMPVKNGIECLQLIREDPRLKEMPVIMYTTSVSKVDIDKSYEAGANYFVIKPNTLEGLAMVVKKLLSMDKAMLSGRVTKDEFVVI